MSIVARVSGWARLLLVLTVLGAALQSAVGRSQEPPVGLDATLQALHDKARDARGKRDFGRVEELRIERLSALASTAASDTKETAESPWVAGAKAIAEADSLIKGMQYEKACELLKAAWQPFTKTARDKPVFGDIAMKLFEATQAALAVYPEFPAVDAGMLRQAVQLAADADPCAVEALAADAFLTTPDPGEAFERAELRPSLGARNRRLLGISHDAATDVRPLPWHAPTEYLKAKSSSFVLGDLGYYERFLDPRHALRGRDAYGEPISVVMGGSLLLSAPDGEGLKRPFVAEYEPKTGRWLRLRPRILRVEPPSYQPQSWQIDEAGLNADIRAAVQNAAAERQRAIRNRLMVSAEGLKAATKAKAHIRKILGWMEDPPKGQKVLTFDEAIEMVAAGYVNYARRYPEERDQAEKAYNMVVAAGKEWTQFREVGDVLLAAAGDGTADVDAAAAAKALMGFLSVLDEQDLEDAEPATEDDDAVQTEVAPLSGRELRSKLSQQKEQYDMLALFQLMNSVHRPALQAIVERTPPPAPGTAPQPDDEDPSPTAKLGRALKYFDTVRAKATREQPAPDGAGPPTKRLSLTLNALQETAASLRDMSAALRQIGGENERADFLDRFVRTLDQVAQPISLEGELVRFCDDSSLRQQWKLGRMTWRVYDIPADAPHDRLANMVNYCPRLCFALDDFAKLIEDMEGKGDDGMPTTTRLPLRPGCTTNARNRLVENRSGKLTLRVPRAIADPYTALLLDIEEEAGDPFGSGNLAASGERTFWLDDDSGRVDVSLLTDAGNKPAIVVRFPGVDGHVPLGAAADSFEDRRFMKDSRGNTIVRDTSSEQSPTKAHFYRITSESGGELTERAVNYCIQDWLDLDRNIINGFLPDLMMHAPSLPAWQFYRNEYRRPAPTDDWEWTIARRAFSLLPEPAANAAAPGTP
jgi:hypothetical protein